MTAGAPFDEALPVQVAELAPGIRRTVELLRSWGYRTIDSGDGATNLRAGMACARDYPHVTIDCGAGGHYLAQQAVELVIRLRRLGIRTGRIGSGRPCIQATYDPEDNTAYLEVMELDDAMLPRDPVTPEAQP